MRRSMLKLEEGALAIVFFTLTRRFRTGVMDGCMILADETWFEYGVSDR